MNPVYPWDSHAFNLIACTSVRQFSEKNGAPLLPRAPTKRNPLIFSTSAAGVDWNPRQRPDERDPEQLLR